MKKLFNTKTFAVLGLIFVIFFISGCKEFTDFFLNPDNTESESEYDENATEIIWKTDLNMSIETAKKYDKLIVMLYGRETCPNCNGVKKYTFESTDPDVKGKLIKNCIVVFVDCDGDDRADASPYLTGLGAITLPAVCIIDPNNSSTYYSRTTDFIKADEFYSNITDAIDNLL